jgi:hypothetical protein
MTAVIIRLISNLNKSSKDIVFSVSRNADHTTYNVTNTIPSTDLPHEADFDSTTLWKWFRTMLGMLQLDEDPYMAIQLEVPLLPTVIVSVNQLDVHYHRLLDAFEVFMDAKEPLIPNPPTNLLPSDLISEINAPADNTTFRYFTPTGRQHLFFDDDD